MQNNLRKRKFEKGSEYMYGKFEDIPENIQKYIEALYGISYNEWLKVSVILSKSFDKKRSEAEKEFCLTSENDIVNPF